MILLSADRSFGIIAAQKNLLDRQQLQKLEAELRGLVGSGERLSLEQLCLRNKVLDPEGIKRIVTTRARHGRSCADCGAVTFLLPGQRSQSTPCEHCGGPLSGGRVDTPQKLSRAAPAEPGPSTLGPGAIGAKREYLELLARCATEEDAELFVRTANLAVELDYVDQARMLLAKALELAPNHPYAARRFEDLSQRASAAPSLPGRQPAKAEGLPRPSPQRAQTSQRDSTRYIALVKAPAASPPLAKPGPFVAPSQGAGLSAPAPQDPALESLDFHGAETYIDEDEAIGGAPASVPARAPKLAGAARAESQPGASSPAVDEASLEVLLNAPAGYSGPVAPEASLLPINRTLRGTRRLTDSTLKAAEGARPEGAEGELALESLDELNIMTAQLASGADYERAVEAYRVELSSSDKSLDELLNAPAGYGGAVSPEASLLPINRSLSGARRFSDSSRRDSRGAALAALEDRVLESMDELNILSAERAPDEDLQRAIQEYREKEREELPHSAAPAKVEAPSPSPQSGAPAGAENKTGLQSYMKVFFAGLKKIMTQPEKN